MFVVSFVVRGVCFKGLLEMWIYGGDAMHAMPLLRLVSYTSQGNVGEQTGYTVYIFKLGEQ